MVNPISPIWAFICLFYILLVSLAFNLEKPSEPNERRFVIIAAALFVSVLMLASFIAQHS